MSAIVVVAFVAQFGPPAIAAEAPQAPVIETQQSPEEKAVQAYGEGDKACGEWTDGCVICVRGTGDTPACSLPGIACVPHGVQCTTPVAPPATPK